MATNDAGGSSFSLVNTVGSATPSTWGYDPVANTFTERAPFPLPAGGFASSVINGHLYFAGGRDATNTVIQVVWDYDLATSTWTARIGMPGTQVDLPESGAALDKLCVFEGGPPFGPIQGASTTAGSAKHADSWSALQSRASATAVGGASTQDWNEPRRQCPAQRDVVGRGPERRRASMEQHRRFLHRPLGTRSRLASAPSPSARAGFPA